MAQFLVSNFVTCRTEFDRRQFRVRFVVDKRAVREVFLRIRLFSPISITLRMFHNLTIFYCSATCSILANAI